MLEDRDFYDKLDNSYNQKYFDEVEVNGGGKKMTKRNKRRKNKSTKGIIDIGEKQKRFYLKQQFQQQLQINSLRKRGKTWTKASKQK